MSKEQKVEDQSSKGQSPEGQTPDKTNDKPEEDYEAKYKSL